MPDANGAKPLEQMSGVELRAFAREQGLRITYLQQRPRDQLVVLVREAIAAQAEAH